jgi:hypothetical protein
MKLNKNHIEFENYCKRIIGLTVDSVEYHELDYFPDAPIPCFYTNFSNIHSVDFSIIIHSGNDSIQIFWSSEFFQFGIGLKINEASVDSNYKNWDVSKEDIWSKFIGEKVSDINIGWEDVIDEKSNDVIIYPQFMIISFTNENMIIISAAEFLNSLQSEVMGMFDNLIVTDDENLAKQVKMLP